MGKGGNNNAAQVGVLGFYFIVALCVAIYVVFWRIPTGTLAGKQIEMGFFMKLISVAVSTVCGILGLAVAYLVKRIFAPDFVIGSTQDVIWVKIVWGLIVPGIGVFAGATVPTLMLLEWW